MEDGMGLDILLSNKEKILQIIVFLYKNLNSMFF